MAGRAVAQADEIGRAHALVTLQAPTHILHERTGRHRHLAHVTVAGLASHAVGNMGAVIEMDKVGLNRNRHPGNRLGFVDVFF